MLLRKIILENYGLYAGRVEFDLAPRVKYGQERPIILLGGKNGTGKTTLLEALRLVLYGKAVLGDRVGQNDYETFLRRQIHRGGKSVLAPDFARVAVEFDYVAVGEKKTYFAERSWTTRKNKGVKEFLQIKIDGEQQKNVTSDYWQSFVEGLIPERLSQLFFFDGEKIKSIADDHNGGHVLADSIKTLLGLDVVDRLKADLSIYMAREIRKHGAKSDKKAWQDIETKIRQVKREIERKLEELAKVRTAINGVLADIRNRENRLHREGHFFASRRDELENEKSQSMARMENLENQIRTECEKTFPFALCPTIGDMLREQIQKEKELKRWSLVRDELAKLQDELLVHTKKIGKTAQGKAEKIIKTAFETRLERAEHIDGIEEIHGLSESTADQILGWMDEAENQARPKVQKAGQLLVDLQRKLRNTTKELTKSPDEARIRPIFDELSVLNQRLGEFQQKDKQLHDAIRKKEYDLKVLQRELKKYIDRQLDRDSTEGRITLVKNIQPALDTYLKRLTGRKIDQLRQDVVQGFNILSHKGDMVSDLAIDPETFSVTLYDRTGKAIPKESLSAGEKQLFAVAMLWGLARTSGRPLPVIIDTPLGRLDSDHRRNLIENYFPRASHQVILLSTDTEVDQQLYKQLSPDISHCYHLHYDQEANSTTPLEEYFWKERGKCLN